MSPKIVTSASWQLPGVGEIKFRRNLRAKRLTISIRPNTGVRVTMPGLLSFKAAQDFVEQKKDWIAQKMSEFSQSKGHLSNESNYRTRSHLLQFYPTVRENIYVVRKDAEIKVFYPTSLDVTDRLIQEAGKKGIELALRHEAHSYLPNRLKDLAEKHGFKYNDVRIKKITSRWGSCSSKNNINLSIYLMKLPDDLIDYILLHELTHTIHKNHGVNFWNHLQQITRNAKGFASRVRKYRTGI